MSVEDKGKDEDVIQPDKDGKHPDSVPWHQYVGTKESLGAKLDAERAKVSSLEEKLKAVPNADELERVKKELTEANDKLQKTSEELNTFRDKTLSEKRNTLIKRGIPEDKAKAMSEKELDGAFMVLEHSKPGSDIGGGGGSGSSLTGSPRDLALRAYTK